LKVIIYPAFSHKEEEKMIQGKLFTKQLQVRRYPQTAIDNVLERLRLEDVPGKSHVENYMRHKWRMNHKGKTLESSFTSLMLFLRFYRASGKPLEKVERSDIEAFLEHEQDRDMHISTVRLRLACLIAFFHYLMEQDALPASLLKKTIKLKLPETLPRAINPKDVRKLLSVIDKIRDRALILLLLRTGIRIGEALSLTLNDIDMRDKKVHLYQGEKNSMGRVVYLSHDAHFALKRWFAEYALTGELQNEKR
jgi:site-specific recombinase XerD